MLLILKSELNQEGIGIKRDIIISFLVIIALFLIPTNVASIWKKYSVINVAGNVTRLYDLFDYAYRDELENYADDDPARDIYTDKIEGMSLEAWNDLKIKTAKLVCVFDSGKYAHPYKLASKSRPVVYHYEIYELKGIYYLRVVYLVSHKADKVV